MANYYTQAAFEINLELEQKNICTASIGVC